MKKITLIALVICTSISATYAQDKAFHKGSITIDPSIGIVVYKTKSHFEQDSIYNNVTVRSTKDDEDGAAATIYSLTAEYGVAAWLGLGFRFGYSNYFEETKKDSAFNFNTFKYDYYSYKPEARSIDFGLNVNFHLVRGKRFDMPICLTIGYSNFKYSENNPDDDLSSNDNGNAVAKDNGMNYGILLMPKIYFGEAQHVGLAFHIGYLGSNYPSITTSDNSDSNLNDNSNALFKLKGNGFNMGIGLSIKI